MRFVDTKSAINPDRAVNLDIICHPSWPINDIALASSGEGQENPPFLVSLATIGIKTQNLRILGIKPCEEINVKEFRPVLEFLFSSSATRQRRQITPKTTTDNGSCPLYVES